MPFFRHKIMGATWFLGVLQDVWKVNHQVDKQAHRELIRQIHLWTSGEFTEFRLCHLQKGEGKAFFLLLTCFSIFMQNWEEGKKVYFKYI